MVEFFNMFRFYITPQEIKNKVVTLGERHSRKIRKVLRMKPGDLIEVFDGTGWRYEVQLTKITNDETIGKIIAQELTEEKTGKTIIQALPKSLKVEYLLQKSTELGADSFIFFESEYSQLDATKIREEKVKRWRTIVKDSSEQSERIFLPTVELFTKGLPELLESLGDDKLKNALYLDIEGSWLPEIDSVDYKKIVVFIGPEGGFSPKEKELFRSKKVRRLKIAETVLRAESAGPAFLAQLQLLSRPS